ncbi:rho GTPase-activating protein 5-like [Phalaenopsis equestris]|uniref:rho GTPase-activating protein 5-like n=1 Tax=Phalaenopsis equestris TaxID=78828 RepID=UPI0009E2AC15|nr:rho GTPase-activating protein 5-like [Phalaenopsis equestris]
MAAVLPPLLRNPTNIDGSRGEPALLSPMSSHGVFEEEEEEELSFLAILLAVLRKYLVSCMSLKEVGVSSMEIGYPTDVRHVAHVTFDRFHGFLGLPVEFEPEVPQRAPSASANVFGVSAESMQCSLDHRGNSVPTILLLMQRRLYQQGGLRVEGIFRIAAENSQEELVRDQLNNGIIQDGIDVHCLAGLIKAWFRELPSGVLDYLEPEVLMQCQSEEDCARLMKLLPPTQAALLDWAINLMADVVHEKQRNKMNARNVAVVFAPNMTQIADPRTAIMHVVHVMNFLKMLILRTVKEREEAMSDYATVASPRPDDDEDKPTVKLSVDDGRGMESEVAETLFLPQEISLVQQFKLLKPHATLWFHKTSMVFLWARMA